MAGDERLDGGHDLQVGEVGLEGVGVGRGPLREALGVVGDLLPLLLGPLEQRSDARLARVLRALGGELGLHLGPDGLALGGHLLLDEGLDVGSGRGELLLQLVALLHDVGDGGVDVLRVRAVGEPEGLHGQRELHRLLLSARLSGRVVLWGGHGGRSRTARSGRMKPAGARPSPVCVRHDGELLHRWGVHEAATGDVERLEDQATVLEDRLPFRGEDLGGVELGREVLPLGRRLPNGRLGLLVPADDAVDPAVRAELETNDVAGARTRSIVPVVDPDLDASDEVGVPLVDHPLRVLRGDLELPPVLLVHLRPPEREPEEPSETVRRLGKVPRLEALCGPRDDAEGCGAVRWGLHDRQRRRCRGAVLGGLRGGRRRVGRRSRRREDARPVGQYPVNVPSARRPADSAAVLGR